MPSTVNDVTNINFLALEKIDVKGKMSKNHADKLALDEEYISTKGNVDKDTASSKIPLEDFKQKYLKIRANLLSNIERFPSKLEAMYAGAMSTIDSVRMKNQVASNQLANKYYAHHGEHLEVRGDMPKEWLPEKPVIKEGVK